MSIRYAGVNLSVAPADVVAWVEANMPLDRVQMRRQAPMPKDTEGIPYPKPWEPPPVRVNVLHHPQGASRWSTFYAVVARAELTAIQAAVEASSYATAGRRPAVLRLSDGRPASRVRTVLHMLEPVPLPVSGDLSLLPLVDVRYFWQARTLSTTGFATTFGGGLFSWANFVTAVVATLGLEYPQTSFGAWAFDGTTLTAFPSEYGSPYPPRWGNIQDAPAGAILDAVAAATNTRWVVDYGTGVLTLKSSGTNTGGSRTIDAAHTYNFPDTAFCSTAAPTEADITASDNAYLIGGVEESDAGRRHLMCRKLSGGLIPDAELSRSVPFQVRVSYRSAVPLTGIKSSANVSLTTVLAAAAWLPEFTGRSGNAVFTGSFTSDLYTATTLPAGTLARIGADYYGWFRSNADVTWAGIVRPKVTGHADWIEWSCPDRGTMTTRYARAAAQAVIGADSEVEFVQPCWVKATKTADATATGVDALFRAFNDRRNFRGSADIACVAIEINADGRYYDSSEWLPGWVSTRRTTAATETPVVYFWYPKTKCVDTIAYPLDACGPGYWRVGVTFDGAGAAWVDIPTVRESFRVLDHPVDGDCPDPC